MCVCGVCLSVCMSVCACMCVARHPYPMSSSTDLHLIFCHRVSHKMWYSLVWVEQLVSSPQGSSCLSSSDNENIGMYYHAWGFYESSMGWTRVFKTADKHFTNQTVFSDPRFFEQCGNKAWHPAYGRSTAVHSNWVHAWWHCPKFEFS